MDHAHKAGNIEPLALAALAIRLNAIAGYIAGLPQWLRPVCLLAEIEKAGIDPSVENAAAVVNRAKSMSGAFR